MSDRADSHASLDIEPVPSEASVVDALSQGPVRGRGVALNPGNRFEDVRLHVLGEHLDEIMVENPDGTRVVTQVYRDASKTILTKNDSPDIPFTYSVNPYRGCEHGCMYCYARPYHEYLGLSCGLDFESKIVAKHDAATLLREALCAPKWSGEPIAFSGVTDAYQPLESQLRITRACMEVCAELAQPVTIITKNKLVLRDLDCLQELARFGAVHAAVSITSLDNRLSSQMEPRASAPRERLDAVRRLSDAGIPVRVMVAPIIPALNESEIPAILHAAKEAGAISAAYVLLRLPHQIKALFLDWLRRVYPLKAAHVEAALRDTRGGELNDPAFTTRMRGEGERAEQIQRLFTLFRRRHELDALVPPLSNAEFLHRKHARLASPNSSRGQMSLFSE